MNQNFLNLIAPDHPHYKRGIYAVCSSHPAVLTAAIQKAVIDRTVLLVEATPNQVNQFGGYSGQTPMAFRKSVESLARKYSLATDRLIFGADHLGPYVWRGEKAEQAMLKALDLTREFVAAGFRKLHLDAGMSLKGDPSSQLPHATIVERILAMIDAAEDAAKKAALKEGAISYVIGAETPVPGGGAKEGHPVHITPVQEISEFVELCQSRLATRGKAHVWSRVIAVVAQPGIDFGNHEVVAYDAAKAASLIEFIKKLPSHMTCEVHSTDYQTPETLMQLVADGFRILKVGPCLTYAYREAIFALAKIEDSLLETFKSAQPSNICNILETVMIDNPKYWEPHYNGTPSQISHLRQYSLKDRIRYYWNQPQVVKALYALMNNLAFDIPLDLLLQHWPAPLYAIPDHRPATLINNHIQHHLEHYANACKAED